MEEMILFWLVLLIAFLVIEAATLGLATVWFAGGALVAVLAAVAGAPIILQVVLFFLVSFLLLFFTRPIAMQYFNKNRVRTNAESLVGKQGIVTGGIDNLKSQGQVTVNGQEWSARSYTEQQIPEGAVVEIMAISGVRLIVREAVQTAAGETDQQEEEKGAGE